jgi:hypothetical protein
VIIERGNEEEWKKNVEMSEEDEEEAIAIVFLDYVWTKNVCLCCKVNVVCGSCNVGLHFHVSSSSMCLKC